MINGKSIFSWNVPAVEGGDPEAFVKFLLDNNFEGVCLKAANGGYVHKVSRWSPWPNWGENIRQDLVDAIRGTDLKMYFWHFVYGSDPMRELNVAIEQTSKFQPDGYIWNVEGAFDKRQNAIGNARYLTRGIKKFFPHMQQALCWWALPLSPKGSEWHPIKVANAFEEIVDVAMPMMYWQGKGADAAVNYLHRSLDIWSTFWAKPIIPIGRAYNGDGGYADSAGITAFAQEVESLHSSTAAIPGISWWSADKAIKNSNWMASLRVTAKFELDEPVHIPDDEKLQRLVDAHPELFPEFN